MQLQELLTGKKTAILERWLDVILETYPDDTRRFFKRQKNRFANPVAYEISRGMEEIFEQLVSGVGVEEVSPFLERVIKIRAVQEFSPSRALGFIFSLKDVIREQLAKQAGGGDIADELSRFERLIDQLGLLSLDIYMKRREQVFELRVNEVKNRVGRLLERAGLLCKLDEGGECETTEVNPLT